ncbi:hypothetical protein KY340_04565, partial [Candidatus Woesearchaeota archaeon]|nr:hypothetical protein [Candidatus Woesearchaeota archaeon]
YKPTKIYEDYETLDKTNKGYTAFKDKIIKFIDYKDTLWKEDYNRARRSAKQALKRIKDKADKDIVKKYLRSLDITEKLDRKHLGLGIWIIEVKKK